MFFSSCHACLAPHPNHTTDGRGHSSVRRAESDLRKRKSMPSPRYIETMQARGDGKCDVLQQEEPHVKIEKLGLLKDNNTESLAC